jgi:hypothetical protein
MAEQAQEALHERFGFDFPADFFAFWRFAQELEDRGLSLAEEPLFIRLANVFDVFQDGAAGKTAEDLETRLYKDPPEFVTLLLGDTDGLHWGYYVDDPKALPFAVAHYYQNDAYTFAASADLFEALSDYMVAVRRTMGEYVETDPGNADRYRRNLARLEAIQEVLDRFRTRPPMPRQVTAKTRDGMGIVVPPETYQPLIQPDPFKKWNYRPTEDEVRRYRDSALEALRNGFPGTALKLGKDLWDYPQFFETSCELLAAAYPALDRSLLKERLDRAREHRARSEPC